LLNFESFVGVFDRLVLVQLEKKTRALDEQVSKADREFFDSCKKSESARAEWDYNIGKVLHDSAFVCCCGSVA